MVMLWRDVGKNEYRNETAFFGYLSTFHAFVIVKLHKSLFMVVFY